MSAYIANFKKFQPLLKELVSRDIKIKYRRSVLGVLWTLLNPLLMMVVLSLVFSNLFRFDIENYPVYILSGQVVYNFFSESTTSAMSAIIDNASLLKKVYIPKYMFVFSRVLSSIINVLASHCALLIVMIFIGIEINWTMVLFFIPLVFLAIFCLGVGLILSAASVKFRDIIHLYSVFTTAFMYLTPVIYALSLLPHWLYTIVRLNPITNYLMMYRDLMINGTLMNPLHLAVGIAEAFIVLILGLIFFAKKQDTFILDL